jgi:hypothetical protein
MAAVLVVSSHPRSQKYNRRRRRRRSSSGPLNLSESALGPSSENLQTWDADLVSASSLSLAITEFQLCWAHTRPPADGLGRGRS